MVIQKDFLDSLAEAKFDESGMMEYNRQPYETTIIDSFLLTGNIEVIASSQVLIRKTWDFGAAQDFPDEIEIHSKNATESTLGVYRKKIFSKSQLLKYYQENWMY